MRGRSREKLSVRPGVATRVARWRGQVLGQVTVLAALALCVTTVLAAEPLVLETRREPLNPEDRGQTRVGGLDYRGGLSIESDDPRFGGLSGLLVEPDGSAFLAVTDQGDWVSAAMIHDDRGWLVGLGPARLGHLPGKDGKKLKGKRAQDAEALTRLADGSTLVGFEHNHRIWRYGATDPPFGARPKAVPPPEGLKDLPKNHGLEAMVALADDGLLVLVQKRNGKASFPAYLRQDRRWRTLTYPAFGGFEPSGAARLLNGDPVILERSFSFLGGLSARLMRLDAAQLASGGPLTPRELALFKAPLTLDNFEAVDSRRGPAGETLVYLLSDDNFNQWQRTLLMQFALPD